MASTGRRSGYARFLAQNASTAIVDRSYAADKAPSRDLRENPLLDGNEVAMSVILCAGLAEKSLLDGNEGEFGGPVC
jgi:hypothetical protein